MLLVHGVGSHSGTWWRVGARIAAAGWPVLAVDLRGHGDSPRADRYHVSAYADDLWALRPGGGWDLVVGHSLGGLVTAAAARPGRVPFARRLLLVDPVFELSAEQAESVLADLLAEHAAPPTEAEVLAANPRWRAEDAQAKLAGIGRVSRDALVATMRENSPWAHQELLTGLTVPTLVLGADPAVDAMFTPALGTRAVEANPRISYEVVLGTGHIIQRDDPDAVTARALGLLG